MRRDGGDRLRADGRSAVALAIEWQRRGGPCVPTGVLRGPLSVASVTLLAAASYAARVAPPSPLLPLALIAAALALGRRVGGALACAAFGLLTVWLRPAGIGDEVHLDRPVGVEGELIGGWQRDAFSWSCRARLTRVAQGREVRPVRAPVRLVLGGSSRPPPSTLFRARGYLVRAPPLHNGLAPRTGPLRLRVKSRRLISFESSRDPRTTIRALGAERAARSPGVALARALVLGDTAGLDGRLVQSFRRMGLGHLLAISGLHVGVLAGAVLWIARLALGGLPVVRWIFLTPVLCATAFLSVVGPRPAISRVVVMALLAGLVAGRGARSLPAHGLSLALCAVVLYDPATLDELGFWLTAAATCGVLWAITGAERGGWSAAVRVSCAAQIFTLPWAVAAFHLVSPAAVAHNLWAVPWTALALCLGIAWLALEGLWPALAARAEPMLEVGPAPFRWAGELPSGPWGSVPVAPSRSASVAVAILGASAMRVPWLIAPAIVVGLLASGLTGTPGDEPELLMLDVGQGEALLIRDGPAAALVDGGGWSAGDFGGRILVGALARLGVRRLDSVYLTHPDVDHCGGLVDLLSYLPVDEIRTPVGWGPRGCAVELLARAGPLWRPLWAGGRSSVGRWRLLALHPRPGDRRRGNDRSLVLRLELDDFSALLTGDIEAAAERELVAGIESRLLRADLLKVAHHGSRTSTTPGFLAAVAPRLAWISAGRGNRFGHPHPTVLARLDERRVRVQRTDRDGLLRLRVGRGGTLHISLPGAPK